VLIAQSASSSVTPRQALGGKRAYTFVQFMQLNRQLPNGLCPHHDHQNDLTIYLPSKYTEEEALRLESLLSTIKPNQPALIYYQAKSKALPVILSHKNLLW